MAWIKRNLFFVIGGIMAIGLLGSAGFYIYKGWNHNTASLNELNEIYSKLREITGKKPSPGNDKNINNIEAAKQQEGQVRDWIRQAGDYFKPIAPVPNPSNGVVSSEEFAAALRRMIDQLQHEADTASVALPPQYDFSFKAQRDLVKFSGNLEPLAQQLGEVKTIAEVLFAARVNALDGIQRVRISDDDAVGPQADYFDDHSTTNNLAIMTPYQITFRSFSPEIGVVLAGFASSPHGFVVKGINVQLAGAGATMSPNTMAPAPPPGAPFAPGRGGLQAVLNEQLLRVTLVVEVVKLLPKK